MAVPYKPVSCSLYDRLTDFAVMHKHVKMHVQTSEGRSEEMIEIVKDIITRNKEEFLITESGKSIRLDRIISVTAQ